MNRTRWLELMKNEDLSLTTEEVAEGWVFCCEWDGLLIHESDPEAESCTCIRLASDTPQRLKVADLDRW